MAYQMALDGVTKHGLDTAVKNIMAGSLGHGFMPSPPELRIQIDEVMRPIKEARAHARREAEIKREQQEMQRARKASVDSWTPESRQRANEKWQRAKMQTDEENSYDAAISRLQAASEANGNDFNLDRITNAKTGPFKQVGKVR